MNHIGRIVVWRKHSESLASKSLMKYYFPKYGIVIGQDEHMIHVRWFESGLILSKCWNTKKTEEGTKLMLKFLF